MSTDTPIQALLTRGRLLREHGRHAEAEQTLGEALRLDPANAHVFCEIAFCRLGIKSRERDALDAIDRALALEPEIGYFHAVRSLILHDLERYPHALAAADTAISLDPEEETAHLARAHALSGQALWAQAETSVRRALEINPDYAPAHNLLSTLLRVQNRRAENADQVQFLLERNPEDADAHANAGWAALHNGNRAQAQTHFLEALRLEPENEIARQGLLEAYKSRAWIYRRHLNYCMFMTRFTHAQRWAIVIGFLIAYRFLRSLAEIVGPYWAAAVIGAYLLFVFWSHLARSVGNFVVLVDRVARHALNFQERLDGVLGGVVLAGVGFGVAAAAFRSIPAGLAGLFLLALSIPLSKALLNNSKPGRLVFGAISVLVVTAGLLLGLSLFLPPLSDPALGVSSIALIGVMLSTFLGGVRALNR